MGFRIGILTFHNVPNYGASLQAFAMKRYLEKTTASTVNILDFRCPGNSDEFLPRNYLKTTYTSDKLSKTLVKKLLVYLFYKKGYETKCKKFSRFNKECLSVSPYENVYDEYDYIFCGSDQIWNPEITMGLKEPYFGADKPSEASTVVCSFSASCGDISDLSSEIREELFEKARNLKKIGVREASLACEFEGQGINAVNTIDPTFLISMDEYKEAFGVTQGNTEGYVLEYALRPNAQLDSLAQKIAGEKGLPVKKVCGYISITPEEGIFDAGPEDFIKLVSGADYVVTNSFHGTAFSIIFEKAFNVVLPHSRRGRVTEFLDSLGLEERICNNPADCKATEIDYTSVKDILDTKIQKSRAFINDALSQKEGTDE